MSKTHGSSGGIGISGKGSIGPTKSSVFVECLLTALSEGV